VAIKLCFLIPDTDKPWGSSLMRGNQLCEIARRHLGNRFDCATMKMPLLGLGQPLRSVNSVRQIAWMAACPLDAIYFVTKQCIEELNPISAEILKRRAQGVLFDYVDSNMAKVPMRDADIHLCASQAQYDYMTRKQRRVSPASVALLPHGYDCRVKRCAPATGAVQAIYWGALKNTHIPPAIAREIFVIDGEVAPSAKILDELSQYRLHYGVRIASSGAGKKSFSSRSPRPRTQQPAGPTLSSIAMRMMPLTCLARITLIWSTQPTTKTSLRCLNMQSSGSMDPTGSKPAAQWMRWPRNFHRKALHASWR
jgi:hypothetical protein